MQLLKSVLHRPVLAPAPLGANPNRQAKRWSQQQQGASFPPDPPHPHLEISIQEVESLLGSMQVPSVHDGQEVVQWRRRRSYRPLPPAGDQELAMAAKAEDMGLTPQQLRDKLKGLLLLLPEVAESKLLSLETEDLQDLMCDPSAVACRLVEARSKGVPGRVRLQGKEVLPFIWEHPELLSSRRWDAFITSIPVGSLIGHSGRVTSVAISPDGRHAVSGGFDETLRVWDLQAHTCTATLQGHAFPVCSVAISPDGHQAVSAGGDGVLRVWDLQAQAFRATSRSTAPGTHSLAISPDGRHVVSGDWFNNNLHVWDLQSLESVGTLSTGPVTHSGVMSLAISPDGRHVLGGGFDSTALHVWDLQDRTCIAGLQGHCSYVSSVAISSDGKRAVSGSWDRTLRVWDLQQQACTATLHGHTDEVWAVAVSPDGRHAVSGSKDSTLRVWDLQALACVATLQGHSAGVTAVAITPDGRHAVSGSRGSTLMVWDLQPHTGACRAIAPAP